MSHATFHPKKSPNAKKRVIKTKIAKVLQNVLNKIMMDLLRARKMTGINKDVCMRLLMENQHVCLLKAFIGQVTWKKLGD